MRKPRNTHELFHHWAHMVHPEARCGNVSYQGLVVFSYNEPIGILLPNNRVVLSDRKFSITTSSHQSCARQATSDRAVCFAPFLTRYFHDEGLIYGMHKENGNYWKREAERAVAELIANPRRKKSTADRIAQATSRYNAYRAFFNLDWPELTSEAMQELVTERAKERHAFEAAARQQREERELEYMKEQEADLELWRDHATTRTAFSKIALRLSKDGAEIETTCGAHVPVEVAPALWRLATACVNTKREFVADSNHRVGHYRLDRVFPDGTIAVGCHTIPFDELALMARKLNLTEKAMAA